MIRFLQTPTLFTKILFGAIIAVTCILMVITLIPGGILGDSAGFGADQRDVLAKVGNEKVTVTEAQFAARRMIQQQFGGRAGQAGQLMPFFLQRAVYDLIRQKALVMEAERMGLTVSNDEVGEFMVPRFPQVFPNGQYAGDQAFEAFAEANGFTGEDLKKAVRNQLLITKLQSVVEAGATVSEDDVRQAFMKKNTKVKFEYAVLTTEDLMKQVKPTDAELRAFFDKNKANYANAIPEKRKVQYVYIDVNKLKDKVQVTPDDLKRYYTAHQESFRIPDQVKVRMIAIPAPAPGPDGKVDPKALEAKRARAKEAEAKLKAGAGFAEVVKQYSEDPDSKAKGGEIGEVQQGSGRFPFPEQDKAVFSLNKGQTSGVVESPYGFQIFQIEDKQTAHIKSLDEVKAQIEPLIAAEKAARDADSLANTVQSEARTTSLEKAAAKRGLELMTSPLATRTDSLPGLGQTPQFMAAVFSARDKDPAQEVRLPNGYAVFQVTEVVPPATPNFEQIRDRVEQEFKQQRVNSLMITKLQELSDRARSEHNLKKAAAEVGATVKTSELVGPDGQVPDIGSMGGQASVAFDMKPAEISAPISTGRGGAVLALLERQEPSVAQFDQEKDQLRQAVLQQKRSQIFFIFVDSLAQRLQKEGKIKENKQELERLIPKAGEAS